jgi:flagellar biosynthesis/type III secretory pathway protein FliH
MARVIRAQRVGPGVVCAEVYDARREAMQIVDTARAEAKTLHATALAAGHAAGHAAAAKQLFDLAKLRHDTLRSAEQHALQAVLLVAAELVGKTLSADPAQIAALLAPHLARIRRAQSIVLKVHPADADWLQQHAAELTDRAELEGQLELRADASIARGGCLIESTLGEVDARVETRLTELARALGLREGTRVEAT